MVPSREAQRWHDSRGLHLSLLASIAVWCVARTWLCWTDPVIDFGRELYIPWRLSEGAVLYRDVDDFYGPLSQYFNAGLFRLFGPGLIVLVWANLVIYALTVAALYSVLRRAWSPKAALAGATVFILVFSFGRYNSAANYNFATPYAHEVTHGFLVVVLLSGVLLRWLEQPTRWRAIAAGLLCGLTAVLKPEFVLAAAVMLAVVVVLHARPRPRWSPAWLLPALGAAILPTAAFALYFHVSLPEESSWLAAGRALANVLLRGDLVHEPAQLQYAGLDAPWERLREHGSAIGLAVAWLGIAVGAAFGVSRMQGRKAAVTGFIVVGLVSIGAYAIGVRAWMAVGRTFTPLLLIYVAIVAVRWSRADGEATLVPSRRILLVALSLALLARMILNGRIAQFGFYQASLAGAVVVAALLVELPEILPMGWGRAALIGSILATVCMGVVWIRRVSDSVYAQVTFPFGHDRDRFYTLAGYAPLARVTTYLEANARGQTVLVLPEGLMVNYLARMKSPLAPFFFYSAVTANGRERQLVDRLARNPPDWVIFIPRELDEYGIASYGQRSGQGKELVDWVAENYEGANDRRRPSYQLPHLDVYRRRAGGRPAH